MVRQASETAASEPGETPEAATGDEAYAVVTTGCGLLDRSERGKLALTGAEAKDFLQGQVTNDVLALEPGGGCYAAFLTHKGKMRGDMRILDFGEELFLDCERATLQSLFTLIHRYKLGRDVQLHKRTLECGLLSLIGPRAREVTRADALGPAEHDNRQAEIAGRSVRVIATHLGVDVLCSAEDRAAVEASLIGSGARVVPESVAEILRVEHGRPRYGVDLDETVIPQEAGLNERAVSFTKGCYVGQETVARLFYRGKPNRHLRGLRLSAPVASGSAVRGEGDKEVGRVGSTAVSPRFGPIALGIIRREVQPGDVVSVGEDAATATVTELPF